MKTSNQEQLWWFSANGIHEKRPLPCLYNPVGRSLLEREFSLSFQQDERVVFTCPGILGKGGLWINGAYCRPLHNQGQNCVDITELVHNGINQIKISISDLAMPVFPTGMAAAGIPGQIKLEVSPSFSVVDAYLMCDSLESSLFQGTLRLETSQDGGGIVYLINPEGHTVWQDKFQTHNGQTALPVAITFPQLWSPDTPTLYTLRVEAADRTFERQVGLRQIGADTKHFLLNDSSCFFKGVNRTDPIRLQDGAFCPENALRDVLTVKELGGNLIRCIGCPSKEFLELCDRMGLLLAIGPGYPIPQNISPLQTEFLLSELENTVRSCRSHPSVILWVLAEEGELNTEYLKAAKSLVNSLDPKRHVTMAAAGCHSDIKQAFDSAELDCYSYCADTLYQEETGDGEGLSQAYSGFQGKPLFLTQLGGHRLGANPNYYRSWWRAIQRGASQENLAGICWKGLQHRLQYQIGRPDAVNGWLCDGVLESNGTRAEIFPAVHQLFRSIATEPQKENRVCWQAGSSSHSMEFTPLSLSSSIDTAIQREAWKLALKDHRRRHTTGSQYHQLGELDGPILPEPIFSLNGIDADIPAGLPVLLSQEGTHELEIDAKGLRASEVHLLGMTCFTEAYPVFGTIGDIVLELCLEYTDGSQQTVPLRNGYELSSASLLHGSSLYDPRAIFSPPVYRFVRNEDWEHYQICHYRYSLASSQHIRRLRFQLKHPDYRPLLYGVTIGSDLN